MAHNHGHNIKCEYPTILINPRLRWLSNSFSRVYIRGRLVAVCPSKIHKEYIRKFSPKKYGITYTDVSDCYILSLYGEIKPLYIIVPCGSCRLCREKKSRELMARCTAETNQYGRAPLFITFTYADKYLPQKGLEKKDLQLFFKRLRSRLDYYNVEHNLRYLAVGEYGSKTHRAHYHVILWNFPVQNSLFPSIISVQNFISRAWSVFVYRDGKRVIKRTSSGKALRYPSGAYVYETDPLGMIKILPVTQGCSAYVTKYMRKECFVPEGMNKTFSLASNRNGGIGSDYIKSFRDQWRANPDMTSIPVPDKVTGAGTFHMPITPYVKSLLDPSASVALPKKEYEVYKDFLHNLEIFRCLTSRLRDRDMLHLDRYDYSSECIKEWYDPFSDYRTHDSWRKAYVRCGFLCPTFDTPTNLYQTFTPEDVWNYLSTIIDRLNILSQKILAYEDYRSLYLQRDKRLSLRSERLQAQFKDSPYVDPVLLVERLENANNRSLYKETF